MVCGCHLRQPCAPLNRLASPSRAQPSPSPAVRSRTRTRTVVPCPGRDSASTRPPHPSTSCRTKARPSPVPLLRVEKRGSQIRCSASAGSLRRVSHLQPHAPGSVRVE